MLSIGKMGAGQEAYYDKLASEKYYQSGGEPPGNWYGSGAEKLGLTGQIKSETFRDMFQGTLGGKKLVQNAEMRRAVGYDLTFSAPKSVSVAWSQADPETGKLIREAQQAAAEKALQYVESECGYTRRGKGGVKLEKASSVFATFEHGTSRAQDPQLHTHALMLNVCVREDGTTGTITSEDLFQHRKPAGAVYRAELAFQLEKRLGIETYRDGDTFEILGVPEQLCDFFSKRRQAIEEAMEESGQTGAKAAAVAVLETRGLKEHTPRAELFPVWRLDGRVHDFSEEEVKSLLGKATLQSAETQENLVKLSVVEGVEEIMREQSYFTERDLVRFSAQAAQARGLPADDVIQGAREHLEENSQIVNLGVVGHEQLYTTREHYELEEKLIRDAKEMAIGGEKLEISEKHVEAAIERSAAAGKKLSPEQEKAVRYVLEDSGKMATITGDAGTGKTTVLKPIREALESEGYQVRGAALSGKASQGMQEGAGIDSQTIASFLWEQERIKDGWDEVAAREGFNNWVSEMQEEKGKEFQPIFNPEKAEERFWKMMEGKALTEKTVIVIDEAAMVDTKSLAKLVDCAREANSKVVMIGDRKQLQAIQQGGGYQGVVNEVKGERLTEIFRQKDPETKQAIKNVSLGNTREALEHYARREALEVAETRGEARDALLEKWKVIGVQNPERSLVFAGTNRDVTKLNVEAQKMRAAAGLLGSESIKIGSEKIHEGDRVVFTQNQKRMGVMNGDFGTVREVRPKLGIISVEIDGEGSCKSRTRTFSTAKYSELKLGYAITSHRSQGMTVENAFVLTDSAMIDRQMTYVQVSRAAENTDIFTTRDEAGENLETLVRSMRRDREKELAITKEKQAMREALKPEPKQEQHQHSYEIGY